MNAARTSPGLRTILLAACKTELMRGFNTIRTKLATGGVATLDFIGSFVLSIESSENLGLPSEANTYRAFGIKDRDFKKVVKF